MIINILAFDTATDACTVALQVGENIIERFEIAPRLHATLLLPMIDSVLSQAKINAKSLHAIAFGCGPGSFMGVRLATGVAQGLAFGVGVPVIPISTLRVIAQAAYEKTHHAEIITGWDARMHEIYWGRYRCDARGIMQPQQEDALCAPEKLDIIALSAVASAFAGNAWEFFPHQIGTRLNIYPDAKAMLTIAASHYQQNHTCSPENARPQYVRHRVVRNQHD